MFLKKKILENCYYNKYLNKEKIERDKRLLENYYLNNGYYDVNIESVSAKLNEDDTFKLTYKIDAGEIYKINNAKLIYQLIMMKIIS